MTIDTDLFGHPIAAAANREWVPAAYVDEITPEARPTPSHWLMTLPDGRRALAPDDLVTATTSLPTPLRNADCVEFMWVEHYPDIELEIAEDGSWTVSAQPHPHTETLWVWGDYDLMANSLEDLVKMLQRGLPRSGTSVAYTVLCYRWSESLPFFFREATCTFETGLADAAAAGAA